MDHRLLARTALFAALLLTVPTGCSEPEDEGQNQNANQVDDNDNGDDNGDDAATTEPFSDDCTVGLEPADDPETTRDHILGAFIDADEGDLICLNDGDYELQGQLSLSVDGVEVRGESREGVRLDFEDQDAGGNAIDVQDTDDVTFRSLTVLNPPGNGIEVRGADGVHFDDVAVDWEGEPSEENGPYGLYPVQSEDVVVEHSTVRGASDAGIYLGQSVNGIIRHNEVQGNVAGIEVENSTYVDVHDNTAFDNTGGILIFNLPELQRKEGEKTRVFDNEVYDNNRDNFADDSAIVALVPSGSGVLIIAVQDVRVFDNTIEDHDSIGVAAVSYETIPQDHDDDEYYQYVERADVHDNLMNDNGGDPDLIATTLTGFDEVPAVVWDGVYNDEIDEADRLNCFSGNVDGDGDPVDYANFGAEDEEDQDTGPEIAEDCSHEPLDPVEF